MALVLTTGLLFAGGGKDDPSTDGDDERTEIRFRIGWNEGHGRFVAINRLVEDYNNSQDNYRVTQIGGDEDKSKILTMLNSGNAPEVMQMPYRHVLSLGAEGYWTDLSAPFGKDKSLFYDEVVKLATVDSKLYAVPWMGHSMALVYNRDLLEQAGVDPASIVDLDSLVVALEAVETNTEASGIALVGKQSHDITWMTSMFVYAFGGNLISSDGKSVAINTPEAVAGIDFYMNTLGQYAQDGWLEHDGGGVMGVFRTGDVAFEIQGPWGVTDIWKNGTPFKAEAIALPSIGVPAEIGPNMLTIPSDIKGAELEAAQDFIAYLISKKAQEDFMEGEFDENTGRNYPFRVPMRKDMADSSFFKEFPELLPFIEGFAQPSINSPTAEWAAVKDGLYAPGLNAIATGSKSIEEVLAEMESEGNSLLQ